MTQLTVNTLLRNAYHLLGDGNGGEWDRNPDYTRAIVELVADSVGLGLSASDDRDEILRRIREAGVKRLRPSYEANPEITWEQAHDDLTWISEQNIAHLDNAVIDNLQDETQAVLLSLHSLRQTIADA